MAPPKPAPRPPAPQRIVALDHARSLALLCMAVFHFAFDLMLFGHAAPGLVFQGFWPWFARGIASSFLLLAGVSLWLAHERQIRWRPFAKRFGIVAGAAVLVTLATYYTMGAQYIRWGILHMIAAGSLIGLAFLRLPLLVVLATAAAAFAAPHYLRSPLFDDPAFIWLGLSTQTPVTMDYEPILPWICPVLLGIAGARMMSRAGVWARLARWQPGRFGHALAWPGRHSLAIYLIHQPVLFGAVWAYTLWIKP